MGQVSQGATGTTLGPQGQEPIDKDRARLTEMHMPDLQERWESALIGKGRQDPQRTHDPSAVGSSPTRPTTRYAGRIDLSIPSQRGDDLCSQSLGEGGSVVTFIVDRALEPAHAV